MRVAGSLAQSAPVCRLNKDGASTANL